MNRIEKLFSDLKKQKKKALIIYLTAGFPGLKATERLIIELEKNGADLIEIGIPFSDPLADGPTIQKSSQCALAKGVTPRAILRMARSVRQKVRLPLVFMTYYNPVMHYGIKDFIRDSKKAGIDGVIVPDLPPEEGKELARISEEENFSLVFLAAPTSTKERLEIIASKSKGFIYYVSLTGVTGARKKLPKDIVEHVKALKRITKKPVCVGFGISEPKQARRISRLADGVIIGSAVIKVIEKNMGRKDMYRKAGKFVQSLAKAVHG